MRANEVADILQRRGVEWFAETEHDWITFPSPDDEAWLAALDDLRGQGVELRPVDGTIAVRSAGRLVVAIHPPDRGWLVAIIDDLGFRRDRAQQLIDLAVPIFMAVLPDRPHSVDIARMAGAAGLPVMLHQPMEPRGYPDVNPGKRAMMSSQTEAEWRRLLDENLDALPGVMGLNNHMGSALSRDERAARVLATTARRRDLLLVDSLTVPDSQIYRVCRELGGRCLRRDVFLDNERSDGAVSAQAEQWFELARKHGLAVAIGHPYAVTIGVLGNLLAEIERRQLRLIGAVRLNAWLKRNKTR
ncbi:MAG: divergent polysaccharide deacetylase family protein [Candidatus Dadabacteria bacterium]|nr:MAG: divergent polysaccharide deacetylase family protein [Candidatus Dadabacteria bacterium]